MRKRRSGGKRRLASLSLTALDTLEEILTNSDVKASDRISAAKLVFEIARQNAAPAAQASTLRVVFDGVPQEYAE